MLVVGGFFTFCGSFTNISIISDEHKIHISVKNNTAGEALVILRYVQIQFKKPSSAMHYRSKQLFVSEIIFRTQESKLLTKTTAFDVFLFA